MGLYAARGLASGQAGAAEATFAVLGRASAALAGRIPPAVALVPCPAEGQDDGCRYDEGSGQAGGDDFHGSSIPILPSPSKDGRDLPRAAALLDPPGPGAHNRAMATLSIVATPIGNLGDITLRALETLKAADVIACEDTRHTLKLLTHYEIRKPLVACYAYDEEKGSARILSLLAEGKNVAYCSDAGTPGLSDPGALAAARAREAGHRVEPIPGPSAFAALLSVAGFGGRSVLFDGFLSPKPGRRRSRVEELLGRGENFLLYESPHRIGKLLADIAALAPERKLCIGREMTKIHEEFLVMTAREAAEKFNGTDEARGEFAVLVSGTDLA